MPRGMLQGEPLVEGQAKRLGVNFVAANGATMDNYGQKRIRFQKEGLGGISDLLFQVPDVSKPLASVTRILDKENSVVFSRKQGSLHREQQQWPEDPVDGGERNVCRGCGVP